jgi:DNA-binding CsgD family transcriptional regulator
VALLLAAGIFALRLADQNEAGGILGLLVIPIGVLAAEFGWPGGVIAAAAALGLFAVWNDVEDAGAGPIGYLTRAVVFFGFAAAVGMLASRPSGFSRDEPDHRVVTGGDPLSRRELEVLELLARGATNAEMATHFVISEQTVKSHMKHILKKLGVGNRTEAALRYVQLYGAPTRLDPEEASGVATAFTRRQTGPAWPGAKTEHSGKVLGFSPGGDVLVRLGDGRAIEVPLLDGMRNRFGEGSPALVYLDDDGMLVGWFLPDAGIGVDMQDDRRRPGE